MSRVAGAPSRAESIQTTRPIRWSGAGYGHPLASIRSRMSRAWLLVCEWRCRARERAELRSLSRRDVADFCRSTSDARHEANKPFWRA